jgi:hypothetical protein
MLAKNLNKKDLQRSSLKRMILSSAEINSKQLAMLKEVYNQRAALVTYV